MKIPKPKIRRSTPSHIANSKIHNSWAFDNVRKSQRPIQSIHRLPIFGPLALPHVFLRTSRPFGRQCFWPWWWLITWLAHTRPSPSHEAAAQQQPLPHCQGNVLGEVAHWLENDRPASERTAHSRQSIRHKAMGEGREGRGCAAGWKMAGLSCLRGIVALPQASPFCCDVNECPPNQFNPFNTNWV